MPSLRPLHLLLRASSASTLRPVSIALRAPPLLHLPLRGYSNWREEIAHKWKNQDEIDAARKWLDEFTEESIPRKNCEISFSQASGPGGQNVNRSSTKATLHLDLAHKAGFLPPVVLHKVRENSRHLTKHDAIVVQSDESRVQHENLDHCFHRLYTILTACVRQDLPGETTPEKHKHVMELQKAERADRARIKNAQKSKKDARRGKDFDT